MKKRATRKREPNRPAGLERMKWTPRVDPEDVRTFQAVRDVMAEAERRRVSDAEVFRQAVAALVASLGQAEQTRVTRSVSAAR